jgi:hypothetical protein
MRRAFSGEITTVAAEFDKEGYPANYVDRGMVQLHQPAML